MPGEFSKTMNAKQERRFDMAAKKAVKDLTEFKVAVSDSVMVRLVKYMMWLLETAPGRPVPMTQVAKVVFMLSRAGSEKDVKKLRGAISGARKKMIVDHNTGILVIPGMGLRPTTGSEDAAKYQYEKDAKRVVSAVTTMDRTRSIIKTSDIKDPVLKSRVTELSKAVKVLTSQDILDKLRLPPSTE